MLCIFYFRKKNEKRKMSEDVKEAIPELELNKNDSNTTNSTIMTTGVLNEKSEVELPLSLPTTKPTTSTTKSTTTTTKTATSVSRLSLTQFGPYSKARFLDQQQK